MTGNIDTVASQSGLRVVESEGSDTSTGKTGVGTPKTEGTEKDGLEKTVTDPRLKDATTGSISGIKDLYQGPEDSKCVFPKYICSSCVRFCKF